MIGNFEENSIILGDSYKLIKQIPDKSIDLIITDPPYLIENTNAGGKSRLSNSIQKMNNQLADYQITNGIKEEILEEFLRITKTPNIYIWCNHKQIPMYLDFFVNKNKCSFDIIIWNKQNATPLFNNKYLTDKEYCLYFRKGGYCQPQSYEDAKTIYTSNINITDKNKFEHPTIKPQFILDKLVKNSSKENDIVFDPFAGSGSTLVAAKNLNRRYLGMEIDPKWLKVAQDRLNNVDANGQTSMFTF